MARVDASVGFKMAVIIFGCTGASVNPQDGGHASLYNSRWRTPSLEFIVATA